MNITRNTVIRDILSAPELSACRHSFVGSVTDYFDGDIADLTLDGLQSQHTTWDAGDMAYGLNRLYEIAKSENQYIYHIYSDKEIESDPTLRQVTLIYHPAQERKTDTFVLLLSGGGYGAVCNISESIPVAARLNELGITAFSLNYRTVSPESFLPGLMPQPLDDVAKAVQFICDRFGFDHSDYLVGGFSAGGHLAAMWGAKCKEYELPAPKMLLLDYPLVSFENFPDPVQEMFGPGLLGAEWSKEKLLTLSAHRLVRADYPKTYLITALDDDTVPLKDSHDLEEALNRKNVPHLVERIGSGGHGFGLGSKTDAVGWVDRAIHYLNEEKSDDSGY